MTGRQWKTILIANVWAVVLVLSPFLPGPGFLSGITNTIFSAAQLAVLLLFTAVPIGIVGSFRQARKPEKSITPVLLWTLPIVIFVFSFWGGQVARKISRGIAMTRAGKIISAAEKYHHDYNRYPETIEALVPGYLDYVPQPWIMGISSYEYAYKKDSFDLTFAQNLLLGFNFEVVVYNSLGKHEGEGETPRLHDTGRDKWKYYIYD